MTRRRAAFPLVLPASLVALALSIAAASPASAQLGGRFAFHALRMVPNGASADRYAAPSWGGGVEVTADIPGTGRLVAGVFGFEIINMLSSTIELRDPDTGLRVEQQTTQDYIRFTLGPEFGLHGDGFIRPHVGANLAAIVYNIHTDVVVPDDVNRENEIRQNLDNRGHGVFGYDLSMGGDLNIHGFLVDVGARYMKSFGVPAQLGPDAVRVHPEYFQIYFGIGARYPLHGARLQ